jgi:D-sedoheptulose 7-phosphate isomerase
VEHDVVTDSISNQFAEHQRVISAMLEDARLLERIADRIVHCFDSGGKLLLLGNGGSAADAQHIAAELVGRFKHDRRALPAIALTTDTSILTAVANDVGAENCFVRQVEALATPQDIIWALSVSGRSPNVIRALEGAKAMGIFVIGFTGRLGEQMRALCDLCLTVDHEVSDRVQEAHQLAYHLVCDQLEQHYL